MRNFLIITFMVFITGITFIQAQQSEEPDFATCPVDYDVLGELEGYFRRTEPPDTYTFILEENSNVLVYGYVKEGHPEAGCPLYADASIDQLCGQRQNFEEISVYIDGILLGHSQDAQDETHDNAWFETDRWDTQVDVGSHELVISHKGQGTGPESVEYKLTLCGIGSSDDGDGGGDRGNGDDGGDNGGNPPRSMLVSDASNDRVLNYDVNTGAFLSEFIAPGAGNLDGPLGLEIGPDGLLYVASFESDQILRFNANNGAFVDEFASGRDINGPNELQFGPNGILYVTSFWNNTIVGFAPDKTVVLCREIGDNIGPIGLSFDANNRMFITGLRTNRIYQYDYSLDEPNTCRGNNRKSDHFTRIGIFNNPTGITVGPDNLLYISFGRRNVVSYDPISRTSSPIPRIQQFLSRPREIAFSSDGDLFVSDLNRIVRVDAETNMPMNFVMPSSGGLSYPIYFLLPNEAPPGSIGSSDDSQSQNIAVNSINSAEIIEESIVPNCNSLTEIEASAIYISSDIALARGGNLHCRALVENNQFLEDPSAIGNEAVLNRQIIQAVDIFLLNARGTIAELTSSEFEVCLQGLGEFVFMDAQLAPRVPQTLPSYIEDGYTCANISGAGIVLLIESDQIANTGNTHQNPITLENCIVTTTHMVNLRTEASIESSVVTILPYNTSFTATARQDSWFHIIYLDMQHWVSGDFLTLSNGCE